MSYLDSYEEYLDMVYELRDLLRNVERVQMTTESYTVRETMSDISEQLLRLLDTLGSTD